MAENLVIVELNNKDECQWSRKKGKIKKSKCYMYLSLVVYKTSSNWVVSNANLFDCLCKTSNLISHLYTCQCKGAFCSQCFQIVFFRFYVTKLIGVQADHTPVSISIVCISSQASFYI